MAISKLSQFRGSTFIEVLVVLGITAFVLIAMLNASIVAIIQTKYAKNKATAVRYTQEGMDWIRSQRDKTNNWDQFTQLIFAKNWADLDNGDRQDICLSSLAFNKGDCHSGSFDFITGTKFTRQANIIVDKINNWLSIEVETGWRDGLCKNANDYFCHKISIVSHLTSWQD